MKFRIADIRNRKHIQKKRSWNRMWGNLLYELEEQWHHKATSPFNYTRKIGHRFPHQETKVLIVWSIFCFLGLKYIIECHVCFWKVAFFVIVSGFWFGIFWKKRENWKKIIQALRVWNPLHYHVGNLANDRQNAYQTKRSLQKTKILFYSSNHSKRLVSLVLMPKKDINH